MRTLRLVKKRKAALNVLRHGGPSAPPEQTELRAGPLSMLLVAGELRYLRWGAHEVLRRIHVAVRDDRWRTVPARISQLTLHTTPDSFHVTYEAEHLQGDLAFAWRGRLTGSQTEGVSFAMDGEAHSDFLRNRIGICVLHPTPACAGARVRVETAWEGWRDGTLPTLISPGPILEDIRALAHEVAPGVWAQVRFTGDVFEMEDQRNWTDASFKTFCPPLRLPYPTRMEKGTRLAQSVTLRLLPDGEQAPAQVLPAEELTFTVHNRRASPSSRLPRFGLAAASHGRPLGRRAIARLRRLRLAHLRVELDLAQPSWPSHLHRASHEAELVGARLELLLLLSRDTDAEIAALAKVLERRDTPIATGLVFHAAQQPVPESLLRLARERLARYAPTASFGTGALRDFVDLNRHHPSQGLLDILGYPLCPHVHSRDGLSLMENLQALSDTVSTARRLGAGLPLALGPVTLKRRPVLGATQRPVEPEALTPDADERQLSLSWAAWTVGCLDALCRPEVASLTLYETTGPRGVMEPDERQLRSAPLRSLRGAVFPVYLLLASVAELPDAERLDTHSSEPLRLRGLALRTPFRGRLVLANLTDRVQRVRLQPPGRTLYLRHLDERNVEWAMRAPENFLHAPPTQVHAHAQGPLILRMLPHALALLDWTLEPE